jgi:hypothetical protein
MHSLFSCQSLGILFSSEDGDSKFLLNVSTPLLDYMASYTTPYHTIGSNFNYELETHHDQLQWYKIRGFSVTNVKNDSLQIKNTNKLHNFIMTYFKIFYEE